MSDIPRPTGKAIEITSVSEWNTILRAAHSASLTVFVDFTATWCPPCKMIAPIYAQLASEFPLSYFLKVDVDLPGVQGICGKYKIKSMPTFFAIKKPEGEGTVDKGKGEVVQTISGADVNGLRAMVTRHASKAYVPATSGLSQEVEKEKEAGNAHFKASDYNSAIEAYSRAISLASSSSSPQSGVGTLYTNRALSYLKLLPSLPSASERNKLRPKLMQDAITATEIEPSWGKAWVRMADAILESGSEESLLEMPEDTRAEGRRKCLQGAEEALENAVSLSDGKTRNEALALLETVKKRIAELPPS